MRRVLTVAVALVSDDEVYAQALAEKVRLLLSEDEMPAEVTVSAVSVPER